MRFAKASGLSDVELGLAPGPDTPLAEDLPGLIAQLERDAAAHADGLALADRCDLFDRIARLQHALRLRRADFAVGEWVTLAARLTGTLCFVDARPQ